MPREHKLHAKVYLLHKNKLKQILLPPPPPKFMIIAKTILLTSASAICKLGSVEKVDTNIFLWASPYSVDQTQNQSRPKLNPMSALSVCF